MLNYTGWPKNFPFKCAFKLRKTEFQTFLTHWINISPKTWENLELICFRHKPINYATHSSRLKEIRSKPPVILNYNRISPQRIANLCLYSPEGVKGYFVSFPLVRNPSLFWKAIEWRHNCSNRNVVTTLLIVQRGKRPFPTSPKKSLDSYSCRTLTFLLRFKLPWKRSLLPWDFS